MRRYKVEAWEPRYIYSPDGYIKAVFYDNNKKRIRFSTSTKKMAEAVELTESRMKVLQEPERHQFSLEAALQRMWDEDWQFSKDTQGKRQHVIEVLAYFGDVQLYDITNSLIRDFIAHLRHIRNNADGTINRKLAIIRKALRVAWQQWEILDSMPYVPTFREHKGGHREYITPEQFSVIQQHIAVPSYHDLLTFLYLTGLRPSECFKLKWSDIDWNRRCVILRDTKNGETWITPLVNEALSLMRDLQVHSKGCAGNVFRGDKRGVCREWNHGRAILGQSENKKFTPYALRHTFARRMLRLGYSTAQVRAWLHHKSLQTTESYIQLEADELFEIRDGLNAKMFLTDNLSGNVLRVRN